MRNFVLGSTVAASTPSFDFSTPVSSGVVLKLSETRGYPGGHSGNKAKEPEVGNALRQESEKYFGTF